MIHVTYVLFVLDIPNFQGIQQTVMALTFIGISPPPGSPRAAPIACFCGWTEVSLSPLIIIAFCFEPQNNQTPRHRTLSILLKVCVNSLVAYQAHAQHNGNVSAVPFILLSRFRKGEDSKIPPHFYLAKKYRFERIYFWFSMNFSSLNRILPFFSLIVFWGMPEIFDHSRSVNPFMYNASMSDCSF